jgi:hypothetical protein
MRLLFFSLLVISVSANAQTSYNKFLWQPNPAMHAVDAKYKDEAAVYVNDGTTIEYIIEKDGFFIYKTVHRIIHINTDKGIEYFNRVYLPYDEGLGLVSVKARTLLPSGKVIELDEKNIKDLREDNRTYKIFALDGLSKGCEVEYYYTLKKPSTFFGTTYLTYKLPVASSHFSLITPSHLKFDTKTFNGLPLCKDSTDSDKHYQSFDVHDIDASPDEKYSMTDANLKRVEYKLSYNQAKSSTERLFTWNELAKKVFTIYTEASDKEIKKVKDLVEDAGVQPSMTEADKIVKLERYLKKNFISRDDIEYEDDILKVIKNKVSSEKAFCRLFAVALGAANVNFQIVLVGDRSDIEIDQSLENWNSAKNFLFYFPGTGKYLAPSETSYRYPWIPPTWAATTGLFCVVTQLGSFQSAMGEIKNVALEDSKHSCLNMNIKAEMDKDLNSLMLDVEQIYGGYPSTVYKSAFVFSPAEEQQKILKEMVKFGTNSENIISSSLENKDLDLDDPYKPFIIKAKVKSGELVEKAGEKIIIKVGDLIGEQSQLYEEKERKTNITLEYPHSLIRKIDFTIPDGYEVKNLKDLIFNEVDKEGDQLTMGFVTSYTMEKNILHIVIDESYNRISYPVTKYAEFKRIINASADFNKVALVLDKKK